MHSWLMKVPSQRNENLHVAKFRRNMSLAKLSDFCASQMTHSRKHATKQWSFVQPCGPYQDKRSQKSHSKTDSRVEKVHTIFSIASPRVEIQNITKQDVKRQSYTVHGHEDVRPSKKLSINIYLWNCGPITVYKSWQSMLGNHQTPSTSFSSQLIFQGSKLRTWSKSWQSMLSNHQTPSKFCSTWSFWCLLWAPDLLIHPLICTSPLPIPPFPTSQSMQQNHEKGSHFDCS